jgi:hypothetical protein
MRCEARHGAAFKREKLCCNAASPLNGGLAKNHNRLINGGAFYADASKHGRLRKARYMPEF